MVYGIIQEFGPMAVVVSSRSLRFTQFPRIYSTIVACPQSFFTQGTPRLLLSEISYMRAGGLWSAARILQDAKCPGIPDYKVVQGAVTLLLFPAEFRTHFSILRSTSIGTVWPCLVSFVGLPLFFLPHGLLHAFTLFC